MPKISAATIAAHREQTLTALLDAVDELSLLQGDAISMADVAARAGVARSAVYNYAADRASLFAQARSRATADVRANVAELADRSDLPGAGRLRAIISSLLAGLTDDSIRLDRARALHYALSAEEQSTSFAAFSAEILHHISDTIEAGRLDGSLDLAVDPDLDASFIVRVLEVAVSKCLAQPETARAVGIRAISFLDRAMARQ